MEEAIPGSQRTCDIILGPPFPRQLVHSREFESRRIAFTIGALALRIYLWESRVRQCGRLGRGTKDGARRSSARRSSTWDSSINLARSCGCDSEFKAVPSSTASSTFWKKSAPVPSCVGSAARVAGGEMLVLGVVRGRPECAAYCFTHPVGHRSALEALAAWSSAVANPPPRVGSGSWHTNDGPARRDISDTRFGWLIAAHQTKKNRSQTEPTANHTARAASGRRPASGRAPGPTCRIRISGAPRGPLGVAVVRDVCNCCLC